MVKCAKIQHLSFAGGFAGTPSLAVGLFYTCILQGASQAQGPCCTNPSWGIPNLFVKEKPWGWLMSCDIYAAEKAGSFEELIIAAVQSKKNNSLGF